MHTPSYHDHYFKDVMVGCCKGGWQFRLAWSYCAVSDLSTPRNLLGQGQLSPVSTINLFDFYFLI